MHRFTYTRSITIISLIILALLGAGIVTAVKHHGQPAKANTEQNTTTQKAKPATPRASSSASASAAATGSVSDADKQAAAASAAKPVTLACKLLTASAAKQILGGGAQSGSSGSTAPYQAADTSVTACAYSDANGSIQLTIRAPSGHLGVSENATVFGSGKPAGAVSVPGYGESAFWDPSAHTLNILGSNNWYIITRNTNTQADAEAAAKLLAPGF